MLETFIVQTQELREYSGKRGAMKDYTLNLRDASKEHRSSTAYSYTLTDADRDKYWGKLVDETVTIGVTKHESGFNGVVRVVGPLVKVGNASPAPATK